jgi:hypothetical protein
MKKGIAKREKLSRPVAIRWATVVVAGRKGMLTRMVRQVEIPMLQATGTPMARRVTKLSTSIRSSR